MQAVIWWIRRDLRLGENPVLQAALASGQPVVPVFIFDPAFEKHKKSRRFSFLIQGLADLDAKLQQIGSQLILRQGRPLDVLKQLLQEIQAERIFAQADYSPYACRRDMEVSASLVVEWIESQNLFPPNILLSPDGKPYSVFTPFSRMWRKLPAPFSAPCLHQNGCPYLYNWILYPCIQLFPL